MGWIIILTCQVFWTATSAPCRRVEEEDVVRVTTAGGRPGMKKWKGTWRSLWLPSCKLMGTRRERKSGEGKVTLSNITAPQLLHALRGAGTWLYLSILHICLNLGDEMPQTWSSTTFLLPCQGGPRFRTQGASLTLCILWIVYPLVVESNLGPC